MFVCVCIFREPVFVIISSTSFSFCVYHLISTPKRKYATLHICVSLFFQLYKCCSWNTEYEHNRLRPTNKRQIFKMPNTHFIHMLYEYFKYKNGLAKEENTYTSILVLFRSSVVFLTNHFSHFPSHTFFFFVYNE